MDLLKPNLSKPFSIEAYEAGAEFCTRDGSRARVLCTDLKDNCFGKSVVVAVNGSTYEISEKGTFNLSTSCLDVFEVDKEAA